MENKKKKTEASKAVGGKSFSFGSKMGKALSDLIDGPKPDTSKKKATYYLQNDYIKLIDDMARYHGVSQAEIIQRALDKAVPDKSKYKTKREEF